MTQRELKQRIMDDPDLTKDEKVKQLNALRAHYVELTDEELLAAFRRELTALAACYGVSPVPVQLRKQDEERRDIQ